MRTQNGYQGSVADLMPADANELFSAEFSGGAGLLGASVGSLTFTRSTSKSYYCNGVEKTVAVNEPAFNADGYICEPATTNRLNAPNDLTNAAWVSNNATASVGGVSPDGDRYSTISQSATNGPQSLYQLSFAPVATPQAFSVIVSKVTSNAAYVALYDNASTHVGIVDLGTGAVTRATGADTRVEVEDLGDEWRVSLCSKTGLQTGLVSVGHSSNGNTISFAGNPGNKIHVRRLQLEENYAATSWTATTRGVDTMSIAMPVPITGDWMVEVQAIPYGAQQWDSAPTAKPLVSIGVAAAQNSIVIADTAGAAIGSVYDNAAAVKSVSGVLAGDAGGYNGFRHIGLSSASYQRPSLFVDGREILTAATGAGTGVYQAKVPSNAILRIGCASDGTTGAWIIKKVVVRRIGRQSTQVLAASSYNWPQFRGHAKDANCIACIGDSNTDAVGAVPGNTAWGILAAKSFYPQQLYFGHIFGIGSTGAWQGVQRLREHIARRNYEIVAIQFGVNDLNADRPAQEVFAGISQICLEAEQAGIPGIIVINCMPGADNVASARYAQKVEFNRLLANYCVTARRYLIDAWSIFTDGNPVAPTIDAAYQVGDNLHLNYDGQYLLGGTYVRNAIISLKNGRYS